MHERVPVSAILDAVGLLVVVVLHTGAAAIMTRLLRVRLDTRWGPPLFAVLLIPVVLFLSTLVLSGLLGLGPNLGDPGTALFITIVAPLSVGLAIDYLWMPAPEEVEVP